MSDGTRDSFVENDVIGNYALGTSSLAGAVRSKGRKKRKRYNKKVSRVYRRRKRANKGKPKFGTSAWMSYIRKFRKKGGHRKGRRHRRKKRR